MRAPLRLEVDDLILQPLASARAVLSEDESDLGVCLVDIGGGTTDVAIFTQGRDPPHRGDPDRRRPDHQRHRHGAAHADRRTPRTSRSATASRCASSPIANQMIEVPGIGERAPRALSRQTLAEVIEPRVEELFSLVQQVLRDSGFEELLSSGVVLTGGSSVMQGMVELGEEIFHMPVRVGMPRYAGGLAEVVRNPRYATASV